MKQNILDQYRKERAPIITTTYAGKRYEHVTPASYALHAARIRSQFEASEAADNVRLRVVPDDSTFADLAGDSFNPDVNPDIPAHVLATQAAEFEQRIYDNGVCGIVSEYWNGREWDHADSCYGFVGDDWKGSGHDIDLMESALKAYTAQIKCPCCGHIVSDVTHH